MFCARANCGEGDFWGPDVGIAGGAVGSGGASDISTQAERMNVASRTKINVRLIVGVLLLAGSLVSNLQYSAKILLLRNSTLSFN